METRKHSDLHLNRIQLFQTETILKLFLKNPANSAVNRKITGTYIRTEKNDVSWLQDTTKASFRSHYILKKKFLKLRFISNSNWKKITKEMKRNQKEEKGNLLHNENKSTFGVLSFFMSFLLFWDSVPHSATQDAVQWRDFGSRQHLSPRLQWLLCFRLPSS